MANTTAQSGGGQGALGPGIWPPGALTHTGTSRHSLQEALDNALKDIHAPPGDQIATATVIQWGARIGGIIGGKEYFVVVAAHRP